MNSNLPTLQAPIPDWDIYQKAYLSAKSSAMAWVNTVLERLNTVPGNILGYNDTVLRLFNEAISDTNKLIRDPSDQSAKDFLLKEINTAIRKMTFFSDELSDVIKTLKSFKETLPQQAQDLQTIADAAMKDQRADEHQIMALRQKIEGANAEIKSLTAAIIGLAIADGAAITLGVIAVAAAGPIGMITWIFLGVAVAVASVYIAIDAAKIKALKDQIEQDQKAMSAFTADVSALANTSCVFKQFADQAQSIEDNLQRIVNAWQALNSGLQAVESDLKDVSKDYTAEQWQKVKTDLEHAQADWKTFISGVGQLNVKVLGNTAKLELGMNSEEVEKAVKSGETTDFIKYINQVA
jgi:predicted  nucleic acid-binding Zn-ribbon protein